MTFTGSTEVQDWGGEWWEYEIEFAAQSGPLARSVSAKRPQTSSSQLTGADRLTVLVAPALLVCARLTPGCTATVGHKLACEACNAA